jgi:putative hydrolase of the HAD superfamily
MDQKVFEPFFKDFIQTLKNETVERDIDQVISDLWSMTWDAVLDKHKIKQQLLLNSVRVLDGLELSLNIAPYPDYSFLRELPHEKFLVTTSITSLQEKKISALKIRDDFKQIIINDTFKKKQSKKDIFQHLVNEFNLNPSSTYVIGDNADSEIKAGRELGMVTVQMLRPNVRRGNNAHHYIKSFEELLPILKLTF